MPNATNKPPKDDRLRRRAAHEVRGFFEINDEYSISLDDVFEAFELRSDYQKQLYQEAFEGLVAEGFIRQIQGTNTYQTQANELTGRIDHVNKNFAFLLCDDPAVPDVWIAAENLHSASDGDKVRICTWAGSKRSGRRLEGEVKEISERKTTEIVGTFEYINTRFGWVHPAGRRHYDSYYVDSQNFNEATNGQKVILTITQYPDVALNRRGEGRISEVLGNPGENETEMHAILAEFGLPYRFPENVEAEADTLSVEITKEEIAQRRDFREILTFTIDPADAKDFDDAISYEKLPNGNVQVGIHIADVAHYVQPGSALDREAYFRGTSVYLVDRTIPMLPEALSNQLCSLRPKEDKLVFSAVFDLDSNAKVVSEWFGRGIIHSDHRFAYEEAQLQLEATAETPIFQEELIHLNTLAKKLREERFLNGAVNFETIEVKFRLDENARPVEVIQKIRKDAHKLIEEFMLLANKKVAERVFDISPKNPPTMVYRVHEAPDPDRLTNFAAFARQFGYEVKTGVEQISNSLNKLMAAVEGTPEQHVIETLAIRSMAKARYTTDPLGHFGLAFKHYSHFTSPIRRYPDVLAHRLLAHYLGSPKNHSNEAQNKSLQTPKGGLSKEEETISPPDRLGYETLCKHSSDRERLAAEAERASIKYKQVEYLSGFIGEVFEGVVSGVAEFGLFVELNNTASEGMIKMSDLHGDHFELDRERYRLVGRHTGKIYTFGDALSVRVKETNLARRTIDLELIDSSPRVRRNPKKQPSVIPRGKTRKTGRKR